MVEFNQAVEYVLANEGGFVDNASDSGGATNFGISLRFLRDIPSERLKKYGIFGSPSLADVEHMTKDQAILIYEWEFWAHIPFENLLNQRVVNYIFDMCVLHGMAQGIKLLQRATWGATLIMGYLSDDGHLGDASIRAVNLLCSDRYTLEGFTAALVTERAGFCRLLAEIRPKDRENLDGWLKRCYRF